MFYTGSFEGMSIEDIEADIRKWIPWSLECGCECMVEYCKQCRERSSIIEEWRQRREDRKSIERLQSRGYVVTKKES